MTTLDHSPLSTTAQSGSLARTYDRALLTFPGIDAEWPRRMAAVTAGRPWLQARVDEVLEGVREWTLSPAAQATGWFTQDHLHPDCAPAEAAQAPFLLAGTVLTSLASLAALEAEGLDLHDGRLIVTGHSAGLLAAAAAGGGTTAAVAAVSLALAMGVEATSSARRAAALTIGETTPMAAIKGPRTAELVALLTEGVEIAMINAPGEHVLSGSPAALNRFERTLRATAGEQATLRRAGRLPGHTLTFTWDALPNPLPFHHSALRSAVPATLRWGIELRPTLPVIDPATGRALPEVATAAVIESVLVSTQDWQGTLRDQAPIVVLAVDDVAGVHALTERSLAGTGSPVLQTETAAGRRALFVPGAELPEVSNYASFQPQVQAGRLVTRHTRLTGSSPYILAGMTPTTVDAGIVAAAANAGHTAELAGGGQVSERILVERFAELGERLEPGHEVVFNALHLDPYLWDLHLGEQRLVQKARAAGAPICGVTISAGMPEPEVALALLDELNELGIWLNALKPGDVKGIRAALAIAARTDHPLWLHVEGGQAGGHHSWDDLERLLLATYSQIRDHDNVVLAVGGGIGTPDRAAEFLTGQWSLRHGEPAMPVDAILVGTAAMACAESTASPSVKRALAAVAGPADGWVRTATFEAGMTSGLSGLNADIHFVDNSASRAAALLDTVAGDADAVQRRHAEIVAALDRTAKPYFGDLPTMTYHDLLVRFVELTALGRHGRYEDGVWLDPSHRDRFLDLVHRVEARLHPSDEGPITPLVVSVDDPAAVLRTLAAYPLGTRLHPADVDHFVALCRRPGKPVPFVPVIDADVRKWYQSDALWLSHDDRYDADEVLIIPGPAAVSGILDADEPVADLLARFEAAALPQAVPATADPLITAVLRAPVVQWAGRNRRNPLHRIGVWDVGDRAVWTDGDQYARLAQTGETTVELEIGWEPLTAGDGSLRVGFEVTDGVVTVVGLEQEPLTAAVEDTTDAHATLLAAAAPLPDAVMRSVWPDLFATITEHAPLALLDLVHARHRLERSADTTSALLGIEPAAGGYLLTTAAGSGTWRSTDTFFVRQPGQVPSGHGQAVPPIRWLDTPHKELGTLELLSPTSSDPFALVTGDLNPIHRCDALARFVGLPGRIVHGMWTSALGQRAAIELACDGDADRLLSWDITFTAPVLPGAVVTATATRTGAAGGTLRIGVELSADGETVAIATAAVAGPRTAYVFPGQGIQHVGMGMDGYERSAAAREVWDTADAHTRNALGFSILEIVRENPSSLVAGVPGDPLAEVTYRHPAGVLFLTQFTQVAMSTLACAQVAELRERGVFDERAVTAGHSVGEYNALAAVTGTLRLEDLVELVFARGTAMHHLVPRDERGRSEYGLAVVRPHLAGLDHAGAEQVVDTIAARTGELCQIVNHNLKGKQYAVAGTLRALDELAATLGNAGGKPPLILVPGIDVPFHSQALTTGVAEFRRHLDQRLPATIDPAGLTGRYVPNLYPLPFAMTREYVAGVRDVCDSQVLTDLLANWDEHTTGERTRTLLVELLAWQFAMPVRWIETTDVLCGELAVQRIVEVGVGAQPTLTNLTKGALALASHVGTVPQVWNVEADFNEVFAADAPVALGPQTPAEEIAQSAAPTPAPNTVTAVADRPLTHADALRTLIAVRTRRTAIDLTSSIEDLVDGASSRRNQLLMDIGKEFAVSGMDGAHEAPLTEVAAGLAVKAAGYRYPGPVLAAWLQADVASALGKAGLSVDAVTRRVTGHWGLGAGWTDRVLIDVALGREGSGTELVDAAVRAVADAAGESVSPVVAASTSVDSGALNDLGERFEQVLTDAAISLLTGLDRLPEATAERVGPPERLAVLDAEHGAGHATQVAGTFDSRRHVVLDSATHWARADIDHLCQAALAGDTKPELVEQIAVHRPADPRLDLTLTWYGQRYPELTDIIDACRQPGRGLGVDLASIADVVDPDVLAAAVSLQDAPGQFAGEVALVTGASPGSIAVEAVAHLLRGAATVVLVTSNDSDDRLGFYRDLERRFAAPGAELHIIRANLASFSDVDAVLDWLTTPGPQQAKAALWPTLLLPFAADLAVGSLADTGPENEITVRLMSLGVQRLIGRLGELILRSDKPPVTVVLPLSPNHGSFGGDGSYGETKAALETVLNRWPAEQRAWAAGTRLVGAEIGWVRGTGLMAGNDALAHLAEEQLGIRTFTALQMGTLIAGACRVAVDTPRRVDLTGGLAGVSDLSVLLAQTPPGMKPKDVTTIDALPAPAWPSAPQQLPVAPEIDLDEMVVIVGIAEIGPWGAGLTRWQAELGDLPADAVIELAWRMGLITWDAHAAEWSGSDGGLLAEGEVATLLRGVVRERVGIRELTTTDGVTAEGTVRLHEVYLDKPLTVAGTTYPAGTAVRVPSRQPLQRQVGGQFPTGFDPVRCGLEPGLAAAIDPLAAWNLVVTAEALTGAGITAEELSEQVHPARIGNVQGTGMGGMSSLHKLYVDPLLGGHHANDLLQEALGNVVSAHVNQSLIGGYGPMVHPVAACATAAVSLEEAVDKIRLGKADVLVAGGYDDLSSEGIDGFADMAATADNEAMTAAGIPAHRQSRPGDRRRGGFVEAQGGGTMIVARASVALRLGLPVKAVVAYAGSFGDGIHTSIPAPGVGTLAAARGGAQSPLATALRAHGLTPDDIAVVSKHDTSTTANDPNEAFIHATIQEAIGRSPGAPLRVISQKSVTGHAKGGAAAWQLAGLCDVLATGLVPGNHSLASVDPQVTRGPLVVDHRTLHRSEPVRAAALTSLGFGHVSAMVLLAHPGVFLAAVPPAVREAYQLRSEQRRNDGAWRLLAARHGGPPPFVRRTQRPDRDEEINLVMGELT